MTDITGRHHAIPHLAYYFILAQILPISFAHSLFNIARLLHTSHRPDDTKPPSRPKPQSPNRPPTKDILLTLSVALPTILLIHILPSSRTSTDWSFMSTVIQLRLFLLLPLFLNFSAGSDTVALVSSMLNVFVYSRGPLLAWAALRYAGVRGVLLSGSGESWAVSAFGVDFVVWLVGVLAWSVLE